MKDLAQHYRLDKCFSRMGGAMRYVTADNQDFPPALLRESER